MKLKRLTHFEPILGPYVVNDQGGAFLVQTSIDFGIEREFVYFEWARRKGYTGGAARIEKALGTY